MNFNNLSKLFRYINDNGDSITFDYAGGFLINKPSGIDTLSINLSQAQGIDQVGATIQSTNIQPRPVTITGYLVGDMQTENKEKLLSVVRPDLGGKLYADDYYLSVYPTATPTIEPKRQLAQFQLSLLAAYPRIGARMTAQVQRFPAFRSCLNCLAIFPKRIVSVSLCKRSL